MSALRARPLRLSIIATLGVVAMILAISPMTASASGAFSQFRGVSCTTATACTAVGASYQTGGNSQTLAERWNGASWTVQSTPVLARSVLSGVSCPSVTLCTAVGWYYNGTSNVTLAERWNGTSWTVQSTPNPTGATNSQLFGVSCSATVCTAVGWYKIGFSNNVTLAERWNGTAWRIQSTPNLNAFFSVLEGVSCLTGSNCTAVGGYFGGTLAEHWNGTSWAVQSTPTPTPASDLRGVSCPTISQCTAVGQSISESQGQSSINQVAESWNGTSWTIQSSPKPTPSAQTTFEGVSCTTATACTAVGWNGNAILAERWNGTAWSLQSPVNPVHAPVSSLKAVSCPTVSACAAVGFSGDTGGTFSVTLAERWNGTAWHIQTTP